MDDFFSFLLLVSYENIMVSFCRPDDCVCLDKPFRYHRGICLVQDGAISHTAHTTLNLLQAYRVQVLPWPSKSPDLNSVKHMYDIDRMVRRRGPVNVRQYYSNLQWNAIDQCSCLRYVASMCSRFQAVNQANSGHTRY